jgi:hypothetical protein
LPPNTVEKKGGKKSGCYELDVSGADKRYVTDECGVAMERLEQDINYQLSI